MVASALLDENDRPLVASPEKTLPCYEGWMFVQKSDVATESIMGRAVTGWTWGEGCRLLGFHPPVMPAGLSANAIRFLREQAEPWKFIEDGSTLYFETIRQARQWVEQHFRGDSAEKKKG